MWIPFANSALDSACFPQKNLSMMTNCKQLTQAAETIIVSTAEKTELNQALRWELEFDQESYDHDSPILSRFVFETTGRVVSCEWQREPRLIGKFRTYIVSVESAVDEGESIFELFDDDALTMEYFEALYAGFGGRYNNQISSLFHELEDFWRPNLLILDRLTIYPQFRNHDIGLEVITALIKRLKMGIGLIALKPYPLQFDTDDPIERQELGLDNFVMSQRGATLKLRKYYGRLGFMRVPKTPYMVRSASRLLPVIARRIPETLK